MRSYDKTKTNYKGLTVHGRRFMTSAEMVNRGSDYTWTLMENTEGKTTPKSKKELESLISELEAESQSLVLKITELDSRRRGLRVTLDGLRSELYELEFCEHYAYIPRRSSI